MEKLQIITDNTPAEDLAKLAESGNRDLCQQIARHPNTSPQTLIELFRDYPVEVLNNPAIDLLLLENPNFFDALYSVNPNCFANKDLPLFFIEWAANHQNYYVRSLVAANIKNPISILEKLVIDREVIVRTSLAGNHNIPEHIMEQLAKDNSTDVIEELAHNHKIVAKVIRSILSNPFQNYSYIITNNPNIPHHILHELSSENEDLGTLENVASHQNTSIKTLEKLACHSDAGIVIAVVRNFNTPNEILQQFVLDNNAEIVRNVADNHNASLAILEQLSGHSNIRVRASVAGNPNISLKIIDRLIQERKFIILKNLAQNYSVSSSYLDQIKEIAVKDDLDREIFIYIYYNPNSSKNLKNSLYREMTKKDCELPASFDYNTIKNCTDIEIMRLGWTKEMGRNHLKKTYGKRTRLHLTDNQLLEFWQYLVSLPTPDAK